MLLCRWYLAQIGAYSAIFAANVSTAPNVGEIVYSSALAECTNIVDSNDRALLKFDILITQTLRMFIDIIFFASQLQNLRRAL